MITYEDNSMLDNLSEQSVILNQIGTLGWIGTGMTKQIFNKWPVAFEEYRHLCAQFRDKHERELLGTWARTRVNPNTIVCSAMAQNTVGKIRQEVDYDAWEKICKKMIKQTQYVNQKTHSKWKIHTYEKVGASAGTEYEELLNVFKTYFENSNVELVIHAR